MALESEPQSTPLGGSNLDALKSESLNNVDLEDGEITDDDDDSAVPAVSAAPPAAATQTPPSSSTSTGASNPRVPPAPKNLDAADRRDRHDSSLPVWLQRRLGPTPPKAKKGNKGSWGPPHKSNFVEEDEEDDFAVHLEKALQAKAREKAQQAGKGDEGGEKEDHHSGDDDDDFYLKKKRKRKKSREDDADGDRERDWEPKKKRRDGDEDDMIFVRGASPHHDRSCTPPFRNYDLNCPYESYEEDEYDDGFSSRGRGRGSKMMRGTGRGRGRGEGGRGGFAGKRGGKRGNSRGGPGGKSQQRPGRERCQEICMYFMQGKCPKDADECPYSHDAQPRRKMELCKFYNMNCCAKREKCLYMHKDFPCKYFHTGRRCNSGDKCRYSHDPLSDVTRGVLLKHIELAPKEILGEFRRLTREQAIQIIDRAAKMRADGKNPEGVDLLKLHEDECDSEHDRAHTPMPSSPGDIEHSELEVRKSRGEEKRRDHHDSNHDRERKRDRTHSDRRDFSDKKERRERRRKRRWDSPENSPSSLFKLQEALQRQLKEQDDEEKTPERKLSPRGLLDNPNDLVIDEDLEADVNESNVRAIKLSNVETKGDNDTKNLQDQNSDASPSEKLEKAEGLGNSGDDSQDASGVIPSHLPKRQRELFLRIQQQQREAEHNKDSKAEESDDDAGGGAEDDWYSSDEDEPQSLTDVLKNLKEGQKGANTSSQKSVGDKESMGSPTAPKDNAGQPSRRPPLLPTPNLLTDLMNNTAIDQLLSTIRYGPTSSTSVPVGADSASAIFDGVQNTPVDGQSPSSLLPSSATSAAPAPARDPRLSRDPRSRGTSTTSPLASPVPVAVEARTDPRRNSRADRRDPRLDQGGGMDGLSGLSGMSGMSSPRSEQRGDLRQADPRAARTDSRRTSDGSSSSGSPMLPKSIYDPASVPIVSGSGDVDLRICSIASDGIGDVDFRRQSSQFGAVDLDLRRDLSSNLSGASLFPPHDTDLRVRLGLPPREPESDYAAASQGDMDLRRMALPFKPAPPHTPATEIDASLASHSPAPYRVVCIDIPKPDFSNLKIGPRDNQAMLDPRLRRVFGLCQTDVGATQTQSGGDTPSSPPPEALPQVPVVPRSDPRRRNSSSNMNRLPDPRQSRMSVMCPSTPRADDFDKPTLADTDLRMQAQYGRQQAPWESMNNRSRGLLPHPDSSWIANAATPFGRISHRQPHAYPQHRSYTPPPT